MTVRRLSSLPSIALCALGISVWGSPAFAQGVPKWEVEVHGGGASGSNSTEGTASPFGPGQAFTTIAGLSSRQVSSWYFGDGAALLNQFLGFISRTGFPLPPGSQMIPLDSVLTRAGTTRDKGASYGFRISYAISPRFAAEFSLDAAQARLKFTDDLLAGVEASRASFISAGNGLIATGQGVFTNVNITSTSAVRAQAGRQLSATGALVVNLLTQGHVIPYVTVGAGILSNTGNLPSVTLTGNYQFNSINVLVPGTFFPVHETDTVTVRVAADRAMAAVVGGGVKYSPSSGWGVRADVRAHISKNSVDLLVDADPHIAIQAPAGAIASFTIPSIQFSNNAGRPSSLSGPAISGFKTFAGSGMLTQVSVTGGVFWRF